MWILDILSIYPCQFVHWILLHKSYQNDLILPIFWSFQNCYLDLPILNPSYLWHSATLDLKRIEINWIDPHMIRDWVPLIEITIIGLIIISTRDLKKDLSNKSYWSSYDPGTRWVRGRTIGESSPRCSSLSWLSLECVIIRLDIDDDYMLS